MKNNRFAIFLLMGLLAVSLILALFSPGIIQKKNATAQHAETKHMFITAKGIVESEERIDASSQVSSTISALLVKEGDQVKAGTPLVRFDDSKIQTKVKMAESSYFEAKSRLKELETGYRSEDVEMAKSRMQSADAQYMEARDEFERQKRLYEKDATTLVELRKAEEQFKRASAEFDESKTNMQKLKKGVRAEEIEQAKSSAEKADSELRYYQASLKDYTLTSPFNGVVTEKFKHAGESVDVGTPVLELVNPDKLRIRAELEETDVGKVKEGQSIEVTTDAYKEKIYNGTVYKVLPNVKRKSQRTFDPMASFDINTQVILIKLQDFSGLRNNMTVTVRFLQ
jgi:multidrug resistance efflux pump